MFDQILAFDYALFGSINAIAGKSQILDWILVVFAELIVVVLIVGLAVFLSLKRNRKRAIAALAALAAGFLGRVAILPIIRILLPRVRPFLTANVTQLIPQDPLEGSFPSSHATVMFGIAFAVFFYNKKWGAAFLILALLSGFSRIAVGVHYPLDILGGILVGFVSALGVKLAVDYWLKK